ncbi:MAG: hypothetical protein AAFR38_00770 [Planctomycetota bacterium]
MTLVLAYRPFLDAPNLHDVWYLLILPLALLVSVAYKAVRVPDGERGFSLTIFLRQTIAMAAQVVLAIGALYLLSFLVIDKLLPIVL